MGILDQAVINIPRENRMKKFIKKLLGIEDKITSESLSEPKEVSTIPKVKPVKKSPKEIATEKKEPWVAVLDTHINKDNVRNLQYMSSNSLKSSMYNGSISSTVCNLCIKLSLRGS